MRKPDDQAPQERAPSTRARAWFLGGRIQTKQLEGAEAVAFAPLTLRAPGSGHAVVFPFGVLVLVGGGTGSEERLLAAVRPHVDDPIAEPESEEIDLVVEPDQREGLDAHGALHLHDLEIGRLQVVAQVLAKSVVLGHYEGQIEAVFDRVERLASDLKLGRRLTSGKELLAEIGEVLLIQTKTVGRAEVAEKPEVVWEVPALDRLYERLAVEYELHERDVALARKLELISSTAQTYLDLLHSRQSLRVEWYIVILIVFEIGLTLFELAFRG